MKALIAYHFKKVFKNRWGVLFLFLVLVGFGLYAFLALASNGFRSLYKVYPVIWYFGNVLAILLAFDLVHDTARGEAALFFSLPLPRWKYFLARYVSRLAILMLFCMPFNAWILFLTLQHHLYTPRFGSYLGIQFLSFIVVHSAMHLWASIATSPFFHYFYWALGTALGWQLETFFTEVLPWHVARTIGQTAAKVVNVFSYGPGDLSSYTLLWGPHYVLKVALITLCPLVIHVALGSYMLSKKEVHIK